MTLITTNPSISANLFASARALTSELMANLRQKNLLRVTVKELSALSTADLADLGISRSEIKSVARKAVYGA